ncbi:hypothetical protein BGW39_009872, partial [Mortierella sp. 14UC]
MELLSLIGLLRAAKIVGVPTGAISTDAILTGADTFSLIWTVIKKKVKETNEQIVWADITRERRILTYIRAIKHGGPISKERPQESLLDPVEAALERKGLIAGVSRLHWDGSALDQNYTTRLLHT